MNGRLWSSGELTFLDFHEFEDLALDALGTDIHFFNLAERFTARGIPRTHDGSPFAWMLGRIAHLSNGGYDVDPAGGDEGHYDIAILAVRGTEPIALIEFEGDDYGLDAGGKAVDEATFEQVITTFIADLEADVSAFDDLDDEY